MNLLEALQGVLAKHIRAVRCPTWDARYKEPVEINGVCDDGFYKMAPVARPDDHWSYSPTVEDVRSNDYTAIYNGVLVVDDPHSCPELPPEMRADALAWWREVAPPLLIAGVDGAGKDLLEFTARGYAMLDKQPSIILDIRDVIQVPTPYVPACAACGISALGSCILACQLAADGIECPEDMPCCDGTPKVCGCGEELEKLETMVANTTDPAYHLVELTCPASCGLHWYQEDGIWLSETRCAECDGNGGWDEDCWSEKNGHYTRFIPCAVCSPEPEGPDPEDDFEDVDRAELEP